MERVRGCRLGGESGESGARWRYWRGGSEEGRGPELGMEAQERWTVRLEKAKGDEFAGNLR